MADKGDNKKPTEERPKDVDVPNIKVTEEGAVGGSGDNDAKKKGMIATMSDKCREYLRKRSKSKSPEPPRGGGLVEGEGSKDNLKSLSPKKFFKGAMNRLMGSPEKKARGTAEEMASFCEAEPTEQAPPKTRLAPPQEKDLGLATSPSSQASSEEICVFNKGSDSSVTSAPSGYSSLPGDDTDVTSPDDLDSPEDDKTKPPKK